MAAEGFCSRNGCVKNPNYCASFCFDSLESGDDDGFCVDSHPEERRAIPEMTIHPLPSRCRIALLVLAGVFSGLAACKDREIVSYRIPKDASADSAPAAAAAAVSTAAPAIQWAAPAGWQSQPASGMREASFLVPGAGGASADVSVVSFPGTGGDDLANINRWRSQLKLAPVAAAELSAQIQSLKTTAGEFVIADFAGVVPDKGATRLLGAWLRRPDRVWFFKMMGPADLVETQKAAFTGFLQSVTLAEAPAGGSPLVPSGPNLANTNDLPRNHPGMESIPFQAEGGASLLWQAPAGWQNKPGNAMRKGSFDAGGGAEVAITAFPGEVGGVLANVNRWRGQAGLDPVDDGGLAQATTAIDSNGLHLIVVDAEGGSTPIVAALAPWNGGTWFFKLTGPADAVAKAKPAFLEFLKTVKTP